MRRAAPEPAGGCHEPRWSPDGRKLIFAANAPRSGQGIFTVNADGSGLRQVTHVGDADDPSWGAEPAR
jgi:Tol biopolymer transport system component